MFMDLNSSRVVVRVSDVIGLFALTCASTVLGMFILTGYLEVGVGLGIIMTVLISLLLYLIYDMTIGDASKRSIPDPNKLGDDVGDIQKWVITLLKQDGSPQWYFSNIRYGNRSNGYHKNNYMIADVFDIETDKLLISGVMWDY